MRKTSRCCWDSKTDLNQHPRLTCQSGWYKVHNGTGDLVLDCSASLFPGDLFERFEDLDDPDLWQSNSENPNQQEQSRIDILQMADFIVPGHGPMFQVPKHYKHQMKVVMMQQEHFISASSGGDTKAVLSTSTSCIIVETEWRYSVNTVSLMCSAD